MTVSRQTAAIFDVDGTISDTNSTTSIRWLKRQRLSRAQHLLWMSAMVWRAPMIWLVDLIERDLADRIIYAHLADISADELAAAARRCCEELLLPACFPEAIAAIDEHRREGRRIVFISGGLDVFLAPFAEAFGAELIAQRLVMSDERSTGVHRDFAILGDDVAPRSQRTRKAAALRRYAETSSIDLSRSVAYGDSINDLAMLERVGTPIVVRPDRTMRRIARERGWEVRRWGRAGAGAALTGI